MPHLRARGNIYHVVFYHNGKSIERSTGVEVKGNNNRRAKKVAQRIIDEYIKNAPFNNPQKFNQFMVNWLDYVKGLVKPSTHETYDKTVHGKLLPYFSHYDYDLNDLTPQIFTDYFKYLSLKGSSNGDHGLKCKSVKNIKGVLSVMLDYAVENKYIADNPITKSKMPVFENDIQTNIKTYSREEVAQLLKYARDTESHLYIFLLLECYTGMRKGEALALTWNDIDFDNKTVRINKSRTGSRSEVTARTTTPKTQSSNRVIPLLPNVVSELEKEKKRQQEMDSELGYCYNDVVRNINGKPFSNFGAINRVVNRLMDSAGLKRCTVHELRHAVASMLDESGVPIQEISILLGHKSISTTEKIYIHRDRQPKNSTMSALDGLIK